MCVFPQRFLSWLYTEAGLRDLPARHRNTDPLIDACLVALSLAAMESASGVGTKPAPTPELASELVVQEEVTTSDVAGRLCITTRAVVRALNDGRLHGRQEADGRWRIGRREADEFVARYREAAA
ncbi:hypothetical protein [uncultured Jatrophihabitans sp.]|uniref:hypothetical protein n=1 Tax=uncultured Jatrophihabitans sp. TaxID=1610747 RepID=UPI0035C9684B